MEAFEEQLQNLWQQGGRDIAMSFLRRAISMDMPLGKLQAALQFGDVSQHLGSITLREVLAGERIPSPPAATAPSQPARPAPAAAAGRRKRRSADELSAIKQHLARLLGAEPGSLNTTQLVSSLKSEGHDFDSMRVNQLLRTLEADELVADLGGKPKSWRASPKLRAAVAAKS